jgi:hypothetical protein
MFAPAAPTSAPAPNMSAQANTPAPAAPVATNADASSFQPHKATPATNPEKLRDRPKDRSSREGINAQEAEGEMDDEASIWAFAAFLPRSCPFLAHYIVQEILKIVAKRNQTTLNAAGIYRRIYGLGLQNARPPAPAATAVPMATPAGALAAQEVDAKPAKTA